jgi:enterochelin esterase family protein
LNQDRTLTLYTPPGYDSRGRSSACGLLINFDGPGLTEDATTLDNLIGAGKVVPMVAVFIHHIDRGSELGCSDDFTRFLADELVPWTRRQFNVTDDPKRTIIRGLSLGGLMASYAALRRPDVFGNVLSQSGSYQWFPEGGKATPAPIDAEPGWLTQRFVSEPKRDVTFYLEAGRFEHFHPYSLLAENRRFRDVLRAKGYTVHYSEFTGGHDPVNWRGSFADALITLAPK